MKRLKTFLCLAIFVFATLTISGKINAQTLLRGTVSDETGVLPGASVRVVESGKVAITDYDGRYSILVPSGNNIRLIFSFMGKETKTIVYKGELQLDVVLKDSSSELGEVVISARPNINEIDIRSRSGSIVQADIPLIKNRPASSLGLALQGNMPGLQVINRGELGQKPEIRIRGVSSLRKGDLPNEPLYVLDGQVISAEAFFMLNPEDIKDIKVLKDAVATALYGIKAANGVLEIASTRGFNGQRTVSFGMKTGITFRGAQSVKMMDSQEKLKLERLLENPAAPGFLYSEKYIRKLNPFNPNLDQLLKRGEAIIDSLSQINTDWYDKLTRANVYQSYMLSMRGGNENTSYYTSVGYTRQGGQLEGNDYQRISGRIAIDQQLSPKAIWGISVTGGYGKTNTPNGSAYSISDLIYRLNPYESENSKDLYSFPRRSYSDLFNQFHRLSTDKSLGISTNLNYNITKDLELSAVAGFDYLLNENISVIPPTAFEEQKLGIPINERGKLTQSKNTITNTTFNMRLTYNKSIGDHNITLGGNSDYYSTLYDDVSISGRGIFGNAMSGAAIDNSIDGINRATVGAKKELIRNIGVGLVVGYTFKRTYDLFATYKLDASSVLPKEKRYNSAWALGVGWDLKQYELFRNVSWLRTLKLRTSYGRTANLQGVSSQHVIATFEHTASGYDKIRGLKLMALPNPDLRAEQNVVFDYGIRAVIGGTDIDLSFYRRTTHDALMDVPVAASEGFLTQLRNIGVLENRGVDVSLSQQLFKTNDCASYMRLNFSYNRNKVVSLYGAQRLYSTPESVVPDYEAGEATDIIFGLNSQGINPLTGEPTFLDHRGREVNIFYKFKREDYIPLGHSIPPITGGFLYHFEYKNIELDIDLYYTLGGKRAYQYAYVRNFSDANQNAVRGQADDMWFSSGDENKRYPSPFILSAGNENLDKPTSRSIASTDMIRLNMISLRYRLSPETLKSLGMSTLFRYAICGIQASNLFTIKRFAESDPESGSIVAPLQPVVTVSLNLSF